MHFLEGVSGRLQSERKRIGLSQEIFGKELGVSKRTQAGYEGGTNSPDAVYLIAAKELGVDVGFVLFGAPSEDNLSGSEREMLLLFKSAPSILQAAALGCLRSGKAFSDSPRNEASDQSKAAIGSVVGQANVGQVTNTSHKMKFGN